MMFFLFLAAVLTSSTRADGLEECMRGFFYADEGRVDDLENFLPAPEIQRIYCLTKARYRGLLLPHYVVNKNLQAVFPAILKEVGPNWTAANEGSLFEYS